MASSPIPLGPLLKALNPVVRASVERRFEAMARELKFLHDKQDERVGFIRGRGWSDERLRMLFVLNSVYQLFLGPLHSSARTTSGLGAEHPILHGSEAFNRSRAREVDELARDFFGIVSASGCRPEWMAKNTCGDIVYWIGRYEDEISDSES